MTNAVVTFTAKSKSEIIAVGGSQAWTLHKARARQQDYLVCARNAHHADCEGDEPHGSAFLVGRISEVVPATHTSDAGRWLIGISEYAEVDIRDVWRGLRNPVRYTTMKELGIDPSLLSFKPVPSKTPSKAKVSPQGNTPTEGVAPLTIAQAKRGLAAAFGVAEDAVEITIRG